jgi:hypothetical protein
MALYSQGVLRISLVELAFRAFRTKKKKAIMGTFKTIFAPLVFSPLIPVFFMMTKDEIVLKTAITSDEIDRCISILAQLNSNTDEIFDIEKDQRTALIKAAGMFSRPDRDELSRRKKTED